MSLAVKLMKCCTRPRVLDTEELDYSHSNLLDLPSDVFSKAKTLAALSLSSNAIRNLPFEFFSLTKLTHLDLSDNDIEKVSDLIKNLSHLKALDVSKNALTSIPNTIQHCAYLEALELSVNPLGRIPEHLTLLNYLQELYINDIYLDVLPTSIGRLANLLILEVRDNQLTDLPRSLINLTLLKRLDLGNNQLTFLSPVIGHLTSLEELWADSNNLKTLPKDLCYLSNLKFLEVSKNRLEYLPEDLDGWTAMTDLHLSDNYLQYLPETISALTNLNNLQINNNHLSSLPNGLGRLRFLEELSVADNKIKDIPSSIGSLKHLFNLNIDNNDLISLRPEISGCLSLSILSVRNNYLQTLPREISFLTNLVVVNISGNRLQYMPFTLTRLKKLLALWIIENQTRPLIEMEPIELDNGEKALTCFLFPQGNIRDTEEVYSRGKLSSDNDSFHTDVFSELPHNSSIVFDVIENSSRADNYPKDIYTRQQPKRFSRNSESPYATLPNLTPDSERFPSRAYYATKYGKAQTTNNPYKSTPYTQLSEESQSNQSIDRQKYAPLSSVSKNSFNSDGINNPGYVSSLVSGNSSKMADINKVLTPPRVFEPPQCVAQDVSRYQANNNNRETDQQRIDYLYAVGQQTGCIFSKPYQHSYCKSDVSPHTQFMPQMTQLSSCGSFCNNRHPDLNSPPLSCPDTSLCHSNHNPTKQHNNAIDQSQIYESSVEFDPNYNQSINQSGTASPLPKTHGIDTYYSDIGINMQGGYEKLLKEMNIPTDPSSIQALLQLSAHLANQNLARQHSLHSHGPNRYPGDLHQCQHSDKGHYSDGCVTRRSNSGMNLHQSSNSGYNKNQLSQSNEVLMDSHGNRCPSPLYNIPSSVPRYGTNYPTDSTVPLIYREGYTDCTVSHSCTPNTEISSMADCATADSGISSVKTDTMPHSRLYLHNNDIIQESCLPRHYSTHSINSNESEVYQVSICKQTNLGISLTERISAEDGTNGIFISNVHSDGPACRSGKIRPGDRILEINGLSLDNSTQLEAVELLKLAIGTIDLKIKKEKLSTLL